MTKHPFPTVETGQVLLAALIIASLGGCVTVTAPQGPPSQVMGAGPAAARFGNTPVNLKPLTAEQNAAIKGEIASGRWNGQPAWGLNQDQTDHLIAFDVKRDTIMAAWYGKNWVAGQMAATIRGRPTTPQMFGPDYAAYVALDQQRTAYRVANFAAEMATPITGPSSVHVRADQVPVQVMSANGVDPRGTWAFSPGDQTGGRTLTRVSTTNPDPGVIDSAMAIANVGHH